MTQPPLLELAAPPFPADLLSRLLDGQVVVVRGLLQRTGLLAPMTAASLDGIGAVVGQARAEAVGKAGFARIHELVDPDEITAITDAIYERLTPAAPEALRTALSFLFGRRSGYYFERSPNVRFHIPYDAAAAHRRALAVFARRRGDGKVTAHGPHRDAWVDCPQNAINVWIAVGPVRHGNGLTIFHDEYRRQFRFRDGYIEPGVRLSKPLTFDLAPGDAVVFHSNHLHGSELNQTGDTRFVVSFRATFGRPNYPHGHYHHYLHAGLAGGPLGFLAGLPQNLQWSFVRYQARRLQFRLLGRRRMTGDDGPTPVAGHSGSGRVSAGKPGVLSIPVADFADGPLQALTADVVVAKLEPARFVAFERRCPHQGGDLAGGWVDGEAIVCPLHSLRIDPDTGASPCGSLRALRRYRCDVGDGLVCVDLSGAADAGGAADVDGARGH